MDESQALRGPANAPITSGGGLYPQNLPSSQTPHALSRMVRYAQYRAYYEGDQWESRPQPGERRLTFNYARVFVNKAASYLMGEPVGYDCAPVGQAPGPRKKQSARVVEEYLEQVAEASNLAELDLATAIAGGCFGDSAFTVRWDPVAGLPRVTGVQPANVDARWRADDMLTLTWLRQMYWLSYVELTPKQQAAAAGWFVGDIYQPQQVHEEWTDHEWQLHWAGQVVDGGPNPYGVIPYIVFPNLRVPGEFWGESDLADLLGLQRELNTRLSIFARILEVAGNPVTVVTGADEEDTAALRLGPNQMWTLPEGAKAEVLQLLQAGGAEAHFKYIDLVYRTMHDISEMPRTSFGDSGGGRSTARSGVALQIELQPLLHKLARKKAIWSQALERRARLILTIGRLHGAKLAPVAVRVSWPPVLPQDRSLLVAQEVALVGSGIHPATVAMAALNDPDPDAQLALVLEQAAQLKAAGISLGGGGFGGKAAGLGTSGSGGSR